MHIGLLLALAGALVAAGGCTGIGSSIEPDEGIVYHLPRTLLTVTVVKYRELDGKGEVKRSWYQIGSLTKYKPASTDETPPTLAQIESASIPDPGHRYVARYSPNVFSDDRLCVSRSPTGLLQDVNFASDDRTPQMFFNIARFIAGSLGGERKTGGSATGDYGRLQWDLHTGRVDPLDPSSVRNFEEGMSERFGEYLALEVGDMMRMLKTYTPKLPSGCEVGKHCPPVRWTDRCTRDNICYRTQLEVPIGLRRSGRLVDTNYASVINPWDVGAISASRAFLVHKISKFKFHNGVLIGAVIRKPSEAEEMALLPLNIIYAALYTPSAALATAFSTNDAAKKLVADDMANLTKQVNDNTSKMNMIAAGISPNVTEVDNYALTCTAPKANSGPLINIISGSAIP